MTRLQRIQIRREGSGVSEPKFKRGDYVRHLRTGHDYKIMDTPKRVIIEATMQPAYAYRSECRDDNRLWIRPQAEMEDGRFMLASEAALANPSDGAE